MLDHVSTCSTNFPVSKAFYDAVLAPLGYPCNMTFVAEWDLNFPTRRFAGYGPTGTNPLWLIEQRTASTSHHLAFVAPNRAAVRAFHAAALANGGADDGAPGVREIYSPNYDAAFVIDPDGNHVEAVTRLAE